jgi:pimeloyl-ACP methyl ester carboxylesterase
MPNSAFEEIFAAVPAEQKSRLQQFRADHPYSETNTAGQSWRYIACGQGERTIVFLPGAFLTADMWFHPILALEGDYRILAPDAYALQGIFELDDVCRAIECMLDEEAVERATLVGLSAGGGVAQYFLQHFPQRVEHVVLSHCGAMRHDPDRNKSARRLLPLIRWLPLAITRRVLLGRTTGTVPPSSEWVAFHHAYFRERALSIDKQVLLGFVGGSLNASPRLAFQPEELASWPGEMLILASRDDELAYRSLPLLQERYPRATTHVFEQGGHHTFMFFPEAYTLVLKTFLDMASGGGEHAGSAPTGGVSR